MVARYECERSTKEINPIRDIGTRGIRYKRDRTDSKEDKAEKHPQDAEQFHSSLYSDC